MEQSYSYRRTGTCVSVVKACVFARADPCATIRSARCASVRVPSGKRGSVRGAARDGGHPGRLHHRHGVLLPCSSVRRLRVRVAEMTATLCDCVYLNRKSSEWWNAAICCPSEPATARPYMAS